MNQAKEETTEVVSKEYRINHIMTMLVEGISPEDAIHNAKMGMMHQLADRVIVTGDFEVEVIDMQSPQWKIDEAEDLPLAIIEDTPDGTGVCEIGQRNERNIAIAKEIVRSHNEQR